MPRKPTTSQRRATADVVAEQASTAARAYQLRVLGASFAEIAQQCGISEEVAWQLVRAVIDGVRETRKEEVDRQWILSLDQLGFVRKNLNAQILDARQRNDSVGVAKLAEAIVRADESARRLLGIDKPASVDLAVKHTFESWVAGLGLVSETPAISAPDTDA